MNLVTTTHYPYYYFTPPPSPTLSLLTLTTNPHPLLPPTPLSHSHPLLPPTPLSHCPPGRPQARNVSGWGRHQEQNGNAAGGRILGDLRVLGVRHAG